MFSAFTNLSPESLSPNWFKSSDLDLFVCRLQTARRYVVLLAAKVPEKGKAKDISMYYQMSMFLLGGKKLTVFTFPSRWYQIDFSKP